ncbi:MAG: hypothetical protein LBH81_03075 [Rickettsiales bacterium]|jgi:hypothetical protein|nr:hypothetical protein [Rickettsiales bacterium]
MSDLIQNSPALDLWRICSDQSLEAGFDQRPIPKMPSMERKAAWTKRFMAALSILRAIAPGIKKYPDLKTFADDIAGINPTLLYKTISAKIDPDNKKDFEPEIRRAVLPMLRERFERTERAVKYNRFAERLTTAMKKLPKDARYPTLEALFKAMADAAPHLEISLPGFWQHISKSNPRFNKAVHAEYLKHIAPGYEIEENSSRAKRAVKEAAVNTALDKLSEEKKTFGELAEIYLAFPQKLQALVPFSTFYYYAKEGNEVFKKASEMMEKPIVFSETYRHKTAPLIKNLLANGR